MIYIYTNILMQFKLIRLIKLQIIKLIMLMML